MRQKPRADWAIFEAEVLPHVDRLFRLAMWFERDRDEAEDLVQETLTEALESFERYEPGTNIRAWLVSILQHRRSNRHRARRRSRVVPDADESVFENVAFIPPPPERLSDEDVLAALARIAPKFQDVIVLCDVEEMSYKEIAKALAVPIGTVMSRLHRGRELLRHELAGYVQPRGLHGLPRSS